VNGSAALLLAVLVAANIDAADPRIRANAYRNLGDAGDPASLDVIARHLGKETDPAALAAGQDAMARLELGQEELVKSLVESEVPIARAWAAHGLGRYPGRVTIAALIQGASDPEPQVRREVYESLAMLGDRSGLPTLMSAANRDPSLALRQLAEDSAALLIQNERGLTDTSTQLALLQSGNIEQKVEAARQLGRSKDWKALQPLLHLTTSGPQPVRIAAIDALGHLGDQRAVQKLIGLANEETGELRYRAISALARLEDESSVEALQSLLDDQDSRTRVYSIRALYWVGGPEIPDIVSVGLSDTNESVRVEVLLGTKHLEPALRAPLLVVAMKDPSPTIRAEAVRIMGQQAGAAETPSLLEALNDKDALVRLTAADALASLGEQQAIPILEKLVSRTREEDERDLYQKALKSLSQ